MKTPALRLVSVAALLTPAGCGGEPAPPPATAQAASASATPSAAPSAAPSSAPSAGAMVVDAGPPAPAGPPKLEYKAEKLPKVTPPASLDYLAYDAKNDRVWVPEGKTGSVAIYDVVAGTFSRVEGFKTAEREVRGTKRAMGPSAVAIGDGVAYIGDRADGEVCAVDLGAPKLGKCSKLAAPSDGVAYVAAAKEVWVTTPKQDAIVVLDASKPATLAPKTTVKLEGAPEGYASDDTRGLFFTNLEDKDKTIVIDVKTHKPKATWSPGCGSDGPRGIAADAARGFVYVACTDHVVVLDASHDGAVLAKLDTGAGVDNIEWFAARRLLYVAAGKDAKLTVAQIDDHGQPAVVATGETNQGARNAVVDAHGNAYVADALDAAILVFRAP